MATVMVDARLFRTRMMKLQTAISSQQMTKLIGLDILAWVADNFQSEGRAPGGPGGWRPLSAVTIQRRRRGPGSRGDKILQDTGRLKQSFIAGRTGNIFAPGPGRISVGTTISYAPDHEFGKGRIPQRKMLPDRDQTQRIAAATIEAMLRARGV